MRAIMQQQPSVPDWVSPGAASFVLMALDKTAATRAPIARLIQHPWIQMHTRISSQGWVVKVVVRVVVSGGDRAAQTLTVIFRSAKAFLIVGS